MEALPRYDNVTKKFNSMIRTTEVFRHFHKNKSRNMILQKIECKNVRIQGLIKSIVSEKKQETKSQPETYRIY